MLTHSPRLDRTQERIKDRFRTRHTCPRRKLRRSTLNSHPVFSRRPSRFYLQQCHPHRHFRPVHRRISPILPHRRRRQQQHQQALYPSCSTQRLFRRTRFRRRRPRRRQAIQAHLSNHRKFSLHRPNNRSDPCPMGRAIRGLRMIQQWWPHQHPLSR